jgi:hypothetical protein
MASSLSLKSIWMVTLKTYKDFVSVLVEQGQIKHFGDSAGLMGDFRTATWSPVTVKRSLTMRMLSVRNGLFLETESSLFHTVRLPQHPNVSTLSTPMQASELQRRLAVTSSVDELAAEMACEHWGEGKDDCVFDVLTTGDLEMAVVGAVQISLLARGGIRGVERILHFNPVVLLCR